MKLDSEDQRTELLTLLGTVQITTTMGEIGQTQEKVGAIMEPIRNAAIEEPASKPKED